MANKEDGNSGNKKMSVDKKVAVAAAGVTGIITIAVGAAVVKNKLEGSGGSTDDKKEYNDASTKSSEQEEGDKGDSAASD